MAHPIEKKFRKSSRLYGALAIGFIGLIFLPELWSPNIFNRNFSIVMDVACFLGVWRIVQSGYLEIGSDSVVVRTVLRKRIFRIEEIRSVEARSFMQFSSRVMPVLIMKSGKIYKLSDFFIQQRVYQKNAECNQVSAIVIEISRILP